MPVHPTRRATDSTAAALRKRKKKKKKRSKEEVGGVAATNKKVNTTREMGTDPGFPTPDEVIAVLNASTAKKDEKFDSMTNNSDIKLTSPHMRLNFDDSKQLRLPLDMMFSHPHSKEANG